MGPAGAPSPTFSFLHLTLYLKSRSTHCAGSFASAAESRSRALLNPLNKSTFDILSESRETVLRGKRTTNERAICSVWSQNCEAAPTAPTAPTARSLREYLSEE